MRATEYLGREDEFLVWDTAKSNLNYVNVMMQLSPSFGNFKVSIYEFSVELSTVRNETALPVVVQLIYRRLSHF